MLGKGQYAGGFLVEAVGGLRFGPVLLGQAQKAAAPVGGTLVERSQVRRLVACLARKRGR